MPLTLDAPPLLQLTGVSARYDERNGAPAEPPLVDVSLSVEPGQLLAVVGPNGAGKSTLLRVLAGTLRTERGEARLQGRPLGGLSRLEVAREVAFVAQSEEVRFAFSVREVVLMGRAPHQDGWLSPSDEDARRVDEALARFDLTALATRPVDALSGGEKKRVSIARAFAQTSRVLLLDEPTAFLDVRHQVALCERLREAVRDEQKAGVVVTHDLQLAAAHATQVVVMKGGRVLATGLPGEVLTPERLTEAFDWPIHVGRLEGSRVQVFAPARDPAFARPGDDEEALN